MESVHTSHRTTGALLTPVVIVATIVASLSIHLVMLSCRQRPRRLLLDRSSHERRRRPKTALTYPSGSHTQTSHRGERHTVRAHTLLLRGPRSSVDSTRSVIVLFATPASSYDWNAVLWHCIHTCARPSTLRFGIIVHCSNLSDANVDVDSLLRSRVRIYHSISPPTEHVTPTSLSRLVRKFVMGDEGVVVVIDKHARLRPSWDNSVHQLALLPDQVLTCPASSTDEIGYFPCVYASSQDAAHHDEDQGTTSPRRRRAPSLPFHIRSIEVVPSVCWCAEFTAAPARTIKAMCERRVVGRVGPSFVTTPIPLLYDDTHLERAYVTERAQSSTSCFAPPTHSLPRPHYGITDDDAIDAAPTHHHARSEIDIRSTNRSSSTYANCSSTPCIVHKCERVGLSVSHDDRESILKFGSTRAAKLAIKFGYGGRHRSVHRSDIPVTHTSEV